MDSTTLEDLYSLKTTVFLDGFAELKSLKECITQKTVKQLHSIFVFTNVLYNPTLSQHMVSDFGKVLELSTEQPLAKTLVRLVHSKDNEKSFVWPIECIKR